MLVNTFPPSSVPAGGRGRTGEIAHLFKNSFQGPSAPAGTGSCGSNLTGYHCVLAGNLVAVSYTHLTLPTKA